MADVSAPWASGELFVIAGPCAIESRDFAIETAEELKSIFAAAGIGLVYKSSFDKANRTSVASFRGVGMAKGLEILAEVRERVGVPVITDVHEADQAAPAAQAVDMLQTPAFLCRQSDFIAAVAATGKPVNIKKGQFLAPWDMAKVAEKARAAAEAAGVEPQILVCERGSTFGYGNLVVDMRGLTIMKETCGCPVVFDATHSVQLPGAKGDSSGGERRHAPGIVLDENHQQARGVECLHGQQVLG
ncbi:MAG: 3-deoxy-8-phosphooctulonate synthase, partial [Sphingomonadaceae bacterium]|nr:3-deoxy-8-phosphooctulonate synthase [Sphingomonadaceae bacterium]